MKNKLKVGDYVCGKHGPFYYKVVSVGDGQVIIENAGVQKGIKLGEFPYEYVKAEDHMGKKHFVNAANLKPYKVEA